MSITNRVLIQPTTTASTSDRFTVQGTQSIAASVLIDDETVTIQLTHDGSTWQDLKLDNVVQSITSKHSIITISGPGMYRCVKSITSGPVSVNRWITEAEQ